MYEIDSKAEMGIGTLIIFIALLLVAAVASGVLIQSSSTLQEKSLSTGQQVQTGIGSGISVVEVSATDGSDGGVNHINMIAKLSPGSSSLKIDDVLLTMNSFDKSASLSFRGSGSSNSLGQQGYNTFNEEVVTNNAGTATINISIFANHTLLEDYDDDGADDILTITQTGRIAIYFSGGGNYTVPSAVANCAGPSHEISGVTVDVKSNEIESIFLDGDCGRNYMLDTNLTMIITPARLGQGYFTVQYLQRGSNPIEGNLQRGDVIKLFFEAPKRVGEDEKIRINMIPKTGSPTLTEFITPEVISTERVYLYP